MKLKRVNKAFVSMVLVACMFLTYAAVFIIQTFSRPEAFAYSSNRIGADAKLGGKTVNEVLAIIDAKISEINEDISEIENELQVAYEAGEIPFYSLESADGTIGESDYFMGEFGNVLETQSGLKNVLSFIVNDGAPNGSQKISYLSFNPFVDDTQAFAVPGHFSNSFSENASLLGSPLGDAEKSTDGSFFFQNFERGYLKADTVGGTVVFTQDKNIDVSGSETSTALTSVAPLAPFHYEYDKGDDAFLMDMTWEDFKFTLDQEIMAVNAKIQKAMEERLEVNPSGADNGSGDMYAKLSAAYDAFEIPFYYMPYINGGTSGNFSENKFGHVHHADNGVGNSLLVTGVDTDASISGITAGEVSLITYHPYLYEEPISVPGQFLAAISPTASPNTDFKNKYGLPVSKLLKTDDNTTLYMNFENGYVKYDGTSVTAVPERNYSSNGAETQNVAPPIPKHFNYPVKENDEDDGYAQLGGRTKAEVKNILDSRVTQYNAAIRTAYMTPTGGANDSAEDRVYKGWTEFKYPFFRKLDDYSNTHYLLSGDASGYGDIRSGQFVQEWVATNGAGNSLVIQNLYEGDVGKGYLSTRVVFNAWMDGGMISFNPDEGTAYGVYTQFRLGTGNGNAVHFGTHGYPKGDAVMTESGDTLFYYQNFALGYFKTDNTTLTASTSVSWGAGETMGPGGFAIQPEPGEMPDSYNLEAGNGIFASWGRTWDRDNVDNPGVKQILTKFLNEEINGKIKAVIDAEEADASENSRTPNYYAALDEAYLEGRIWFYSKMEYYIYSKDIEGRITGDPDRNLYQAIRIKAVLNDAWEATIGSNIGRAENSHALIWYNPNSNTAYTTTAAIYNRWLSIAAQNNSNTAAMGMATCAPFTAGEETIKDGVPVYQNFMGGTVGGTFTYNSSGAQSYAEMSVAREAAHYYLTEEGDVEKSHYSNTTDADDPSYWNNPSGMVGSYFGTGTPSFIGVGEGKMNDPQLLRRQYEKAFRESITATADSHGSDTWLGVTGANNNGAGITDHCPVEIDTYRTAKVPSMLFYFGSSNVSPWNDARRNFLLIVSNPTLETAYAITDEWMGIFEADWGSAKKSLKELGMPIGPLIYTGATGNTQGSSNAIIARYQNFQYGYAASSRATKYTNLSTSGSNRNFFIVKGEYMYGTGIDESTGFPNTTRLTVPVPQDADDNYIDICTLFRKEVQGGVHYVEEDIQYGDYIPYNEALTLGQTMDPIEEYYTGEGLKRVYDAYLALLDAPTVWLKIDWQALQTAYQKIADLIDVEYNNEGIYTDLSYGLFLEALVGDGEKDYAAEYATLMEFIESFNADPTEPDDEDQTEPDDEDQTEPDDEDQTELDDNETKVNPVNPALWTGTPITILTQIYETAYSRLVMVQTVNLKKDTDSITFGGTNSYDLKAILDSVSNNNSPSISYSIDTGNSTGSATISNGVLSITKAGTIIVRITATEQTGYEASSPTEFILEVNKAINSRTPEGEAIDMDIENRSITLSNSTSATSTSGPTEYGIWNGEGSYEDADNYTWQSSGTFSNLDARKTYCFAVRFAGNDNYAPSVMDIIEIMIPQVQDAPQALSESAKTHNSITIEQLIHGDSSVEAEYGIWDGYGNKEDPDSYEWKSSNVFTGLNANTEYFFAVRFPSAEENGWLESEVVYGSIRTDKPTPATPSAPAVSSKTDTAITFASVAGLEFGIYKGTGDKDDAESYNWQDSAEFNGLDADTEYSFAFRVKETANAYASGIVRSTVRTEETEDTKTTPATPSAPAVSSKTDTTITFASVAGLEYGIYKGTGDKDDAESYNWQDSAEFNGLNADTEYSFAFRVKETANAYASGIVRSTVRTEETEDTKTTPETPSAPAVSSKTDTTITFASVAGLEYGIYKGTGDKDDAESYNWQDSAEFNGLDADTEYSFAFRVKETANAHASGIVRSAVSTEEEEGDQKTTPDAPASAPEVESRTDTSIVFEIVEGLEYGIYKGEGDKDDAESYDWQDSAEFTGLDIDTMYSFAFRVKETANAHASDIVKANEATEDENGKTTPAPLASVPAVSSKTDVSITFETIAGLEYGIYKGTGGMNNANNYNWQDSAVFADLEPETMYSFAFRLKETDETNASPIVLLNVATDETASTIEKTTPDAPSVPSVSSTTTFSITFSSVEGLEYGIYKGEGDKNDAENYTWQDSSEFSGLSENKEYSFAFRLKETDETNASEIVTFSIMTAKSGCGGSINAQANIFGFLVLIMVGAILLKKAKARTVISKD